MTVNPWDLISTIKLFEPAVLVYVRAELGQSMSLVDGFDRSSYQVTRHAAFVAIAKAKSTRGAGKRGWSQIALVSGFESSDQADYKCQ